MSLLQNIHKPIIPQLNYALIEKKYASAVKSTIEQKPEPITVNSMMSKIYNQQQNNNYTRSVQPSNFKMTTEDYDPLAVTFIEPKIQITKIISPIAVNSEPKSLDLAPVNDRFETIDDEFSDFQCAQFTNAENKNINEFTDFQSAFDVLSFDESSKNIAKEDESLNVLSVDVASDFLENQQNLISCEDVHDKYEVFRTLAAETIDVNPLTNKNNSGDILEIKSLESIKETVEKNDVYDDEFGDFLSVEKISSKKPVIEVDWKNVQVCFIIIK